MVVNVIVKADDEYSETELLVWLNGTLQSQFNSVEETCSGGAFCQLMDLLVPGCIDLKKVKFKANGDLDVITNCKLLDDALSKASVKKPPQLEKFIKGSDAATVNLLRWFKAFFDHNFVGQVYDPLVARGGQSLEPYISKKPRVVDQLDLSSEDKNNSGTFLQTMDIFYSQIRKNADSKVIPKAKEAFSCSLATLHFIGKYWPSRSGGIGSHVTLGKAKLALGSNYPHNVIAKCKQVPYCLYLYHREEITDGQYASVVLMGYFDPDEGESKVKLLDVIDTLQKKDAALWNCIVKILNTFEIPLANLIAFYSDTQNPAELISSIREVTPGAVFFGGITNLVGHASHSGILAMEQSEQIQQLVQLVHKELHSFPAALREQLGNMDDNPNFTASLLSHCLLLRTTIHNISMAWPNLLKHFNSQDISGNKKQICSLLSNPTLQVTFLFLTHALQPLCDFQESFDCEVANVLQDVCALFQLYVSRFFKPQAVESFLRQGNRLPRKGAKEHLPRGEMDVGEQVVEFLQENVGKAGDRLDLFYKDAISFYGAVTSSIVTSLPLPVSTLRNVPVLLNPAGRFDITGKAVADLSVQFGLCPRATDVSTLTDEFLEYQLAEREQSDQTEQSVMQCWKAELRIMGRTSTFRKLILSLLALPKTLRAEKLFARVFEDVGDDRIDSIVEDRDMGDCEDKDDATDSSSYKSAPSNPLSPETRESVTSDVVDLTEIEDVTAMETNASDSTPDSELKREKADIKMESIIIDDDDDDDDVIWTETLYPGKANNGTKPKKEEIMPPYQDSKEFAAGDIVWGQVEGFGIWPGLVQRWSGPEEEDFMRKVVWFGDGLVSEIHTRHLQPFSVFVQCFCPNYFATVPTYKDAIFHSLQVAACRSKKIFSLELDCKDELLRVMMDWAFGGFKPSGPDGFKPSVKEDECLKIFNWNSQKWSQMPVKETPSKHIEMEKLKLNLKQVSVRLPKLSLEEIERIARPQWKKSVAQKVKKPTVQESPTPRRKYVFKNKDQGSKHQHKDQYGYLQGNRDCNRRQMVQEVLAKGRNIEDFCLCCGSLHVEIFHPLFEGSLCLKCKDNFTETLYRYDDDGYQSYCTVCCAGLEVILCGHDGCCRSFCVDCVDTLIGSGTFASLKDVDPWICYLCSPESSYGALRPRHDWSIRVQEFFANNSAMAFEPHRVYPSIPANLRRPIRVLSLFDGIGTGYLVLKDLGFKVETYIASEIDEDSIVVSMVHHGGKITQIDDVRKITKKHLEEWGPFDLLIGGSPCNDLSIVNPARKGLFEGTGRLFFDYYRLLNMLKPKEDDPRPFFWLFENVVFMNTKDKADICRFLECNPVLVDAVKVSPANRARYFWGNLPGMNRPITASQYDKLTLQECLENGRTAKYVKVRTITTRTNSLKQGTNDRHFPVSMQGKDDGLWLTELEKIFGFPKHYTDVKNMGRMQRQKVLGKSWSVPVIRHLFAPLKDYFACDEVASK